MPEEVLFETEAERSRSDIADTLRAIADKLDGEGDVTLSAGEDSLTLTVPERPVFEVKVERESAAGGGPGELSIELELEWKEGVEGAGDDDLSVE